MRELLSLALCATVCAALDRRSPNQQVRIQDTAAHAREVDDMHNFWCRLDDGAKAASAPCQIHLLRHAAAMEHADDLQAANAAYKTAAKEIQSKFEPEVGQRQMDEMHEAWCFIADDRYKTSELCQGFARIKAKKDFARQVEAARRQEL